MVKARITKYTGPALCGLVWLTGLLAGWGFAEVLIGSMWAWLGGSVLAYALTKKKEGK